MQVPPAPTNPSQPDGEFPSPPLEHSAHSLTEVKHRGFAFVTFASSADAQDAIDNMDLNELKGRVLKVNLARQVKAPVQGAGNRASKSP